MVCGKGVATKMIRAQNGDTTRLRMVVFQKKMTVKQNGGIERRLCLCNERLP